MPLQRVVERRRAGGPGARDDRPAAADRARGRPSAAVGSVSRPARQRRPGDRDRVDADRTCRARGSSAASRPSTRRNANDALAAGDQEPLQARRRHAGNPPAPRPARHRGRAPRSAAPRTRARRPRRSSRRAAGRSPQSTAAIVCERLCVSAPSTIIDPVHVLSPRRMLDTRRTRLAGGAATLLSSHAGTSPTGDERHNKRKSGPPGRQPQRESARRPVGTISSASDVTDDPNPNSKPAKQ